MREFKDFVERIDLNIIRLNKQREFLVDSTFNPELLFDKTSESLSRKDVLFDIMNVYEDGERKMNVHEFQTFLCSLVNEFFKSTLQDDKISIKVRDRMRYPSIFAVYYNDSEIMQFDIFERYYGKRNMKTKEEIEHYYKRQENEKHEELEFVKEKISDMQTAKSNPMRYIINYHKKRKTDIIKKLYYCAKELAVSIIQFKKLTSLMEQALDKYYGQLKEIEDRYEKYNKLEEDLKNLQIREEIISKVEPIFMRYGYRLETESHKLY